MAFGLPAMIIMLLFLVPRYVAISYIIFILCAIIRLDVWIRVIRRYRYGISEVPGPRFARWSRLWIAKALVSGRSHEIWNEVNEAYGPVARIGPNHVITNDPEITRRILADRSGYVRRLWTDYPRMDSHVPNIVSERDVETHNKIRAIMAPSFTGKFLIAIESHMDKLLLVWLDTLRTRCTKSDRVSCDIGQMIRLLTIDIITKICLGGGLGCIKHGHDMHHVLNTMETGNRVYQYLSVLQELNKLFFHLARIPVLRRILFPKPQNSTDVGRLIGTVDAVVDKRAREGHEGRGSDNLVSSLLSRGMSKEQIDSEVIVALVAGADKTSTSIQSTLLCIITNPQVYNTLRAEIRRAVARGSVSNLIQDCEAKQLVYLQACVLEGLRKFPPLSQLRERVIPPRGDVLGGFMLPEGTFVGLNAWGLQLHKGVYGDDADIFSPERWLTDDDSKLHAMHQTHSLIFGHGSTKCLGASIATMEIAKVIFEILRNFDISIANPHKPWLSQCHGIFSQKNFHVRLSTVDYTRPPAYENVV